jgi:glycosyltransferase involved in cell wall biosynthesis
MKLLIVTQTIDIEHPILGFFHRWVEEFAKHCEHVHVICLQEGKHQLPKNVTVHSLGKDEGKGKFTYLIRFYSLIWKLRHEYDNVFVHMNQIYVILGDSVWHLFRKRVGLWYAHGAVSSSLKIAVRLLDVVFTSTEQGMRINTPKRKIVGQGIDTEKFKLAPKESSEFLRLITVGRISQSKNIDTLLKACALLKEEAVQFKFKIIGPSTTPTEEMYSTKMKELARELGIEKCVEWVGPVSQSDLPSLLQSSDIFIHDGSTNSLDKALLEAALCGCIVISSNPSFVGLTQAIAPGFLYPAHDGQGLANATLATVKHSKQATAARTAVTQYVQTSHSVSNFISGIVTIY